MPQSSWRRRLYDILLALGGIAVLFIIITQYGVPFRLDDVLYMQWANHHSLLDAFNPNQGEIFLSFRPVIGMTFWLLTHFAGTEHYWIWHLVLVGSFFVAIVFTGLTARYISGNTSALQISAFLYWLAFLPILNVLFWFSDMTYAIEMMFCAAAWYYGLRAIEESKLRFWIIANIVGILAVMTKEPAILLINALWLGVVFLRWKKFKRGLRTLSHKQRIIWSIAYGVFFLICIEQLLHSNATSTRFFSLYSVKSSDLLFFMSDRLRYYSQTLVGAPFITYMVLALWGVIISNSSRLFQKRMIDGVVCAVVVIILLFVSKPALIIFLLTAFYFFSHRGSNRASRMSLLSLFAILALVTGGFLLVTIMLVKTQLVEFSFLCSVIGGAGVSAIIREAKIFLDRLGGRMLNVAAGLVFFIGAAGVLFFAFPSFESREALLRAVRTSRIHANKGVQWMSKSLPPGATVLVTAPSLFGIQNENDLTPKDDIYKLYAQDVFPQGFVRSYLQALGRNDLHLGYLEDSTKLSQVLDSCRSVESHYLFLQTGLEYDRFHGTINSLVPIKQRDSLVARFADGGCAVEVWKLNGTH